MIAKNGFPPTDHGQRHNLCEMILKNGCPASGGDGSPSPLPFLGAARASLPTGRARPRLRQTVPVMNREMDGSGTRGPSHPPLHTHHTAHGEGPPRGPPSPARMILGLSLREFTRAGRSIRAWGLLWGAGGRPRPWAAIRVRAVAGCVQSSGGRAGGFGFWERDEQGREGEGEGTYIDRHTGARARARTERGREI